jgi:hypothetical protein
MSAEPPREGLLDRHELVLHGLSPGPSDGGLQVSFANHCGLFSQYRVANDDRGARNAQFGHERVNALEQGDILLLD